MTDQQVAKVNQLLAGAGALYEIEEKLMDPATAVAGCGPAFVYQMIEAMADAGVGLGLTREQALQMAAQTFQGASQMVLETGEHPARLRDAVCSPGGSTIAGVNRLEQVGLRGDIIAGCGSSLQTHPRNGTRGREELDKIDWFLQQSFKFEDNSPRETVPSGAESNKSANYLRSSMTNY